MSDGGQDRPGLVRRLLGLEIVRFGLVGVVNTAFGYGVFVALQLTLGTVTHYLVVLSVSTVIGIVEAYVLQRWLVFRFTGGWWAGLLRFSTVYAVAFGVNLALLPLFVEVLSVPVIPAQGIVTAIQAFGTYGAHKWFTFRHRTDGVDQPPPVADAPGGSATPGAVPRVASEVTA